MIRVRLRELSEQEWRTIGLGQRPDRAIAASLMAEQSDVWRHRRLLGIPAHGWIDYDSLPLGEVPARILAERVGTSAANVRAACRRRGIAPSPARFLTYEWLPCRSYEEATMDAILHYFGVPHEHEVAMDVGRFRADFWLTQTDEFLEVVGMLSDHRYRDSHWKKRKAYEEAGVNVVWVTGAAVLALARDLNPFAVRFGDRTRCGRCAAASPRLRRGLCPRCYDRYQRRVRGQFVQSCSHCGRVFRDRRPAAYCSSACQHAATADGYAPVAEMVQRACTTSLKQVARELDIPYITLCAYVRAHATPAQRALLTAADVARKRAHTSVAWPPLEELERLFHLHGSQWIAKRLGVRRGSVSRRIKLERTRRGQPTPLLKRRQSSTLEEPSAHT